jgi:hypothetical protein
LLCFNAYAYRLDTIKENILIFFANKLWELIKINLPSQKIKEKGTGNGCGLLKETGV